MKDGTWDGVVTAKNLQVIVGGVTVPAHKATIRSSMRDGHPAAVSTSQWSIEAEITWLDPEDLTADVPHPFKAGWLPKDGASVVIQTGDAETGQMWSQHRGVIDTTTGSIADGTAMSRTIDNIDDLSCRVTFGALSARMTTATDSQTTYREMGLSSPFLIDRMLRAPQIDTFQGWHATPPRTWQAIGSAPNQGSLWPELGTLVTSSRRGDLYNGPLWSTTPYGVAPFAYVAEYNLVGSTPEPILTIGLTTHGAGIGRVDAHDGAGGGVFVGHDRDTDEVVYGITTSTGEGLYRLPRNGATRAAVYLKRLTTTSQRLIVRLSDGREVTRDPGAGGYPNQWEAGKVSVDGRGGIGWWMVEGVKDTAQRWLTLDFTPTARIRPGNIQYWNASRDLSWTDPSEWLDEQLKAECAQMWLDEDNIMQWAGRGVLEAQPTVQTVTTNSGSNPTVVDIAWESRRGSLARTVWVNFLEVTRRSYAGYPQQNAAEGKTYDLGRGEEDGETFTVPDDEDWISPDLAPRKMDINTTPGQLRLGSWFGGALYRDNADGEETDTGWAWGIGAEFTRPNLRNISVRVWADPSTTWVPAGHRIRTVIPAIGDKLAAWHHGNPTIRLRVRAILTWLEGERSLQAGTLGPARFTHDVGWRVQYANGFDRVGELLSWLRTVVSSHNPTITGLEVVHDPRRQIGDHIRVEDRDVTGLWWTFVITERTVDTDAFTDTLGGRITGYGQIANLSLMHPAGPTALTPSTDWTREAAA
ncbi:hypothetical protein [Janibacter melonis]|uniref:hypothetical protein n=1 Tax=Janibacter melonis TaxID=262209 RepID=UPI00174EA491|nr:hypothetical protein [Janibacter melonis]